MPAEPAATHPSPGFTYNPFTAVLAAVGIYIISQVIAAAVIGGVASLLGHTTAQTAELIQTSAIIQFLYIASVEALTIGMIYLFLRQAKLGLKDIGWKTPKVSDAGLVLAGYFFYFVAFLALNFVIRALFPHFDLSQPQDIGFDSARGISLVIAFCSLVILPPIAEEILARGFLYTGLKRGLPRVPAAIVTSILFALAHLQLGSGAGPVWLAAMDTFVLSMVLVYLYEITGRLWASIGLHIIKNGIAFAALFILHIR